MPNALIGHTGFVGSNLARQMRFDEFYNSKNIEDIRGRSFDTVICAGMPGAKWWANQNPQEDCGALLRLRAALREIETRNLVIISTIDAIDPQDAYGIHRRALEDAFQDALVVRLPALFGQGLRKNALYDLMTRQRLHEIAPNDVYQWYPIKYLWSDVRAAEGMGLRSLNIASDPISMEDIRAAFFPHCKIGLTKARPASYNVHGGECCFVASRGWVMREMRDFIAGVA